MSNMERRTIRILKEFRILSCKRIVVDSMLPTIPKTATGSFTKFRVKFKNVISSSKALGEFFQQSEMFYMRNVR